jgi:small subunit ribosomal protein S4
MAKSVYQARQLITHGHVAIDGKRVPSPSYIVLKDDEAKLAYAPTSDLSKSDHPIRLSISAEGQTKPDMRAGARRGEGTEEKA